MATQSPFTIEKELLNLSDGTTIMLSRTPGMGEKEWSDTRKHLEANPEEARRMEKFARDAKQVREWMQTQALTDWYNSKLNGGDQNVCGLMYALEKAPEFSSIFNDVRANGPKAAMKHYHNEPVMLRINHALGGVPAEVKGLLEEIQNKALTLHEACFKGDEAAVENYIKATEGNEAKRDIDGKDAKGISCLGYAIGGNRIAIVKLLLEAKANAWEIDTFGGSALHYAAAYGRTKLLEYFLGAGGDVNKTNTQGQTPLALATKNRMKDAIDLLKAKGAKL